MTIEEIKQKLEFALSPRRFIHSVNVMAVSRDLAERYGLNIEKAALAGILHDCARDIRGADLINKCREYSIELNEITERQPELIHGPLGSKIAANEYHVTDEEVLGAISCHTTGRAGMNLLDKIVFLADYIEPNRSFPGVQEVRKTAYEDIDAAMIAALDKTMRHVMSKGALIHPDTFYARNAILIDKMKNKQE